MISPRYSTGAAIADRLREAINSGRFAPGIALRQEDLAAEYKVSRIPIRDALGLLHAEGLVTVEPNRGAYVTSLSRDQVSEIFDLRILLETDVLARALERHTPRTRTQLEIIQRQLDVEDDKTGWILADRAFHDTLYKPSGREKSIELIHSLRAPVDRFSLAELSPGTRRRGWSREHHALIAAMSTGDLDGAVNTLRKHLRNTEKAVISRLAAAEANVR